MMKKVLLALSLIAAGSASAATITSGTAIDTTACTLLAENVTPRLSKSVKGAYICNTTTGFIGVGTSHEAGKGTAYGAGNKGGAIAVETCTSVATNAQTCAETAATNASNS